jgi:uncharacterized membrane protein YfcA
MMTVTTLAALLSGVFVGFSLGLVGSGGSVLGPPLLLYFVGVAGPHIAIGTSALAVSVNAFINLFGHARTGNVRWRCAAVFATVGTLGAFAGSSFGKLVDGNRLLFFFGLVLFVVGAGMLRPGKESTLCERSVNLQTCLVTAVVAFGAGMASGFFGIGGGVLIVPGLILATGMPMIKAVGSSLLSVGCFGLATAANYAVSGYVDWPLAGEFIASGIVGGFLGMTLANRLSGSKEALKRVFAGMVFVVAAYVLYRSGHALTS